ncbi:CHASE domain-containing protein [Desulfatibacillum alkenivorans DSM 16219]|uniref:histidine kinase n=1 Tax=Desulfatibacillum alkenivorans DSM 16219 TaxID=1121393 RepID=A0A1M6F2V0_9BACT|nr:response regulator [Desulfatibacillum alkenivorans]SHI92012.1 CHASE domain-containing protein [Desulfatibacillum alkenivorans DSM 16219]
MKTFLLFAIACVGVTALFFIDVWLLKDVERKHQEDFLIMSETARIRLENTIQSRFNAVSALEALFIIHPRTKPEEFARFAQSLLEKNPPVRALQYADSQTQVTYVYPPKGNEITITRPMVLITDPKRGPFTRKAIETRKATLQGPFPLRQGGMGVVVRAPIFGGGRFLGLAIGVYDLPALLEEAIGDEQYAGISIQLADPNDHVFSGPEHLPGTIHRQNVRVLDQTWIMTSMPMEVKKPPQLPRALTWIFGLAGLTAIIIAIRLSWRQTARLEQTVQMRTKELEEANLALAQDIEDIQRMEKQLLHAHRMRSIGTLSGGIAHEFNNLLSIILGNTELALEDAPENMESRLFLQDVIAACARGKKVVQQIMRFSRKTPSGKTRLNVSPITKQALKLIQGTIGKGVEFRPNYSRNEGWVLGDPQEIQQVVVQLITNSVQALESSGGLIEVRIYTKELFTPLRVFGQDLPPGKYVCLEVQDNGHGIAPQVMERIFEPYFTTRGFGRNLGMGLSVVQGILLGHGGGIRIESEEGRGARALCFFPAAEAEEQQEAANGDVIAGGTESILFVDDEESIARTNKIRLERLGYSVTEALDPAKALAMVEEDPLRFDLVITDLTMPGMNGDRFIRLIRKIRPDLKCILCSGYNDAVSGEAIEETGASAWLSKPAKGLDLARIVRKTLDGAE